MDITQAEFIALVGQRFAGRVEFTDSCWLWVGGKTGSGYGGFCLPGQRFLMTHRYAYERVHGQIPIGLLIRHRCDVPACVRPAHLLIGTHADNARDRDERGRHRVSSGVNNSMAKLDEAQVRAIFDRYQSGGITQRALAAEFGVDQGTVSFIVNGRLWTHLGLTTPKPRLKRPSQFADAVHGGGTSVHEDISHQFAAPGNHLTTGAASGASSSQLVTT